MKVLIVEDEYYTRKAIEKMIKDWAGGAEITDSVENGRYAIESMAKQLPDVVVTDIRMPGMDGIELCKYIKNTYPDVFLVVVSGYAEFEYAQKAIAFGVKEYLLKPLNSEVLFKLLNKLSTELKLQKDDKVKQNMIKKKADLLMVSQELSNALNGQHTRFTCLKEALGVEKEPEGFLLGIVEAQPLTETLLETAVSTWSGERAFAFCYNNQIGIIYLYYGKDDTETAVTDINLLRRSIREMGTRYSSRISAGISDMHHAFHELSAACGEAVQASNYRLIHGWGRAFEYSVERQNHLNEGSYNDERIRSFCRHMENGEKEEAKQLARTIFGHFHENGSSSVEGLQQVYLKVITAVNDRWRQLEQQYMIKSDYAEKFEIGSFSSMEGMLEYVSSCINKVCDACHAGNRKEREDIVEDLKKYVMDNYHTDIILEELAQTRYFINACYLSKLFKSVAGESFSRYLISVRMAKAKMLIEEDHMKISDVASFVGYDAVSHFVQVFKKHYGITPGEHKKFSAGCSH